MNHFISSKIQGYIHTKSHSAIHRSVIHNSRKEKMIETSTKLVNEQQWYFRVKTAEWVTDICHNRDEPWNVKKRKPHVTQPHSYKLFTLANCTDREHIHFNYAQVREGEDRLGKKWAVTTHATGFPSMVMKIFQNYWEKYLPNSVTEWKNAGLWTLKGQILWLHYIYFNKAIITSYMSTVPLFIILSLQKRKCYLIYKTNSFPDSEIKITDFFLSATNTKLS